MSKRDEIKKELEEQEEEFYGDETVSGSSPSPESDDSIEKMMGDAMGEDAADDVSDPKEDGFNIADEIEEDEEEAMESPIEDYQDAEGLEAEALANPKSAASDDDDEEDEEEE